MHTPTIPTTALGRKNRGVKIMIERRRVSNVRLDSAI
jgi:hypothetical protein